MLKLLRKKKAKEISINFVKLKPLQIRLENELKAYRITEKSRGKIIRVLLEDTATFRLDPSSEPDIVYFPVNRRKKHPSRGDKYVFPELTVFLDKRDWLFNADSGECLASGMLIGEGIKSV